MSYPPVVRYLERGLGLSRYSVVRLLETFFRRWWLYLVPFVLLCALGVVSVATAAPKYQSIGTLTVNKTDLGASLGTDPGFGYDTPAVATANNMNSQLKTEVFLRDVANRARLGPLVDSNVITLERIAGSISAYADGASLLKVAAVFDDPTVAQLLAQATIDAFKQSVIDVSTGDSLATADFYDGLVVTYQTDVDTARQALDDYLREKPAPSFGLVRPDDEAAQITRLNADVTAAVSKFQTAAGKAEEARLKTEVTKAEVNRRYILTDAPKLPFSALASKKAMVMQVGVFGVIGVLLMLTAVVVAATFDHSVRFASDLRDRAGLRVLAVIPRSRELAQDGARRAKSRKRRSADEEPTAPARERMVARTVPPRSGAPAGGRTTVAGSDGVAASFDAGGQREPRPAAPRPAAARPDRPTDRPTARPEPPYAAPQPAAPRPRPAAERPPAPAAAPRQRPVEPPPARPSAPAAAPVAAERGWSAGRRPRTEGAPGAPATNGAEGQNGAEPSGWPPGRRSGRPGDIPHAS